MFQFINVLFSAIILVSAPVVAGQMPVVTDVEVAIPLNNIVSMRIKNGVAHVDYYWNGKQKNIAGNMEEGTFSGKTEFGDFSIKTSDIKSVTFSNPDQKLSTTVYNVLSEDKTPFEAVLTLKDDTKLSIQHIKRFDHYSASGINNYSGNWYTNYYNEYFDDLRFFRGASKVNLPFNKLKSISISADTEIITVELKSGTLSPGKLYSENGAELEGFGGMSSFGEIFVGIGNIKSVLFQ